MALTPEQQRILNKSKNGSTPLHDDGRTVPFMPKNTHDYAFTPGGELEEWIREQHVPLKEDYDPEEHQRVLVATLTPKQYETAWLMAEDTGKWLVKHRPHQPKPINGKPTAPAISMDYMKTPDLPQIAMPKMGEIVQAYMPHLNKQDRIEGYEKQMGNPMERVSIVNVRIDKIVPFSSSEYRTYLNGHLLDDVGILEGFEAGTEFPTAPAEVGESDQKFIQWWQNLSEEQRDHHREHSFHRVVMIYDKDAPAGLGPEYIFIDPQGYNYARYVMLPMTARYRGMMRRGENKPPAKKPAGRASTAPPAPRGLPAKGRGVFKVKGEGKPVLDIYESFNGDLYFVVEYLDDDQDECYCYARLYNMPQFAEWGYNYMKSYLMDEYAKIAATKGFGRHGLWKVKKADWMNVNTYEKGLLTEE